MSFATMRYQTTLITDLFKALIVPFNGGEYYPLDWSASNSFLLIFTDWLQHSQNG
ncbi:hypothetical protein [Agarivorans sp. B2Z047]|uniref:hypothetical protein n=1 Tax=Agarivorans sp. B2Z047 TaxID=2652721 RepID=UPI001883C860|nr:hypothetical protein [Agarivorans sp. B2Z047]UQN44792.1 hypothetical protein LQZ07_10080 [Agarivorans sp. B2Z047]